MVCPPLPPSSSSPQLFDFDLEVRPILEVLVGKTVEQALLEVMEEEELAALRVQQVSNTVSNLCCVGVLGRKRV